MTYILTQVEPKVYAEPSQETLCYGVWMAALHMGFASPGETCLS